MTKTIIYGVFKPTQNNFENTILKFLDILKTTVIALVCCSTVQKASAEAYKTENPVIGDFVQYTDILCLKSTDGGIIGVDNDHYKQNRTIKLVSYHNLKSPCKKHYNLFRRVRFLDTDSRYYTDLLKNLAYDQCLPPIEVGFLVKSLINCEILGKEIISNQPDGRQPKTPDNWRIDVDVNVGPEDGEIVIDANTPIILTPVGQNISVENLLDLYILAYNDHDEEQEIDLTLGIQTVTKINFQNSGPIYFQLFGETVEGKFKKKKAKVDVEYIAN